MKLKFVLVLGIAATLFLGCKENKNVEKKPAIEKDSVLVNIQTEVLSIIAGKDSLTAIPSLRYAMEDNETYTATMYGANQITKLIREENIANDKMLGRDYYYSDGQLIFIKEEGSIFTETKEAYSEKLIYFKENAIYKAFEKHQFTEDHMFTDTLFTESSIGSIAIDFQKPYRALQQQDEFAMYFDQFLLIEPQSYLIVENADQSMNAALYIIEGDSLLDALYANPDQYEGRKIWPYHSFQDMNGIERMVYEGAVLLEEES